jgi:hypothetical protein
MAGGLSSLDGTRLLYGPAKQQEFFSQRGFAGIGMADNSEIPTPIHFFFMVFFHFIILKMAYRHKKTGPKSPV